MRLDTMLGSLWELKQLTIKGMVYNKYTFVT